MKLLALFLVSMVLMAPVAQAQFDWCNMCIQFAVAEINNLLNAILNGGIVGGCSSLCSYVKDPTNNQICNIICTAVGIYEFIKFLEQTEINPIYYCQVINMCTVNDCTAPVCANITDIYVNPESGKLGTTFEINMVLDVLHPAGAGMIRVNFWPGNNTKAGDHESLLVPKYDVGTFPFRYAIRAQLEDFRPGVWNVDIQVCQGMCGSKYPHTRLLADGRTQFTITSN